MLLRYDRLPHVADRRRAGDALDSSRAMALAEAHQGRASRLHERADMRTADILDLFQKPKALEIAKRLGFDGPASTSKERIVSFVAHSLGGKHGWTGAIDHLLGALTRDELVAIVEGEWEAQSGATFETTDALGDLEETELRAVARHLVLAEDDDPTLRIEDVVTRPEWARAFRRVSDDPDEFEDELESRFESHGPPSLAQMWREAPVLEFVPGRPLPYGLEPAPRRALLPHQQKALERLREWHAPRERGILCMPTGSGKTKTAVEFIVGDALLPGGTVLWLTHRDELADQTVRTLLQTAESHGRALRVGRYQGGDRKARSPVDVLVASIPTLAHPGGLERMQELHPRSHLVVVDECHHGAAVTWKRVIDYLRKTACLLGLSATPTRSSVSEKKALDRLFGARIVYEAPAVELIRSGVLARPDFEFVPTSGNYRADAKERHEYQRFKKDLPASLIKKIAGDGRRNASIAARAAQLASSGPTLVFAPGHDSARLIVAELKRRDVRAELVTYEDDDDTRARVVKEFRAGDLPVLVNLMLFTEGTDLPNVRNVVIGRPTTSVVLFAQMVGRGLRGPALDGGTESCKVVVFHDQVLGLTTSTLSTNFTDSVEALAAIGCEEAEPQAMAPDQREGVQPAAGQPIPTRDLEGLRARMTAFLAITSGEAPPPSRWAGIALPLCGWWQIVGRSASRYLPVFGPDKAALESVMASLGLHLARHARRPSAPQLLCLPEGLLEQFMDRAIEEVAMPLFVPLDAVADDSAKEEFAKAVLASTEVESRPAARLVSAGLGERPGPAPQPDAAVRADTQPPKTIQTTSPPIFHSGPLDVEPTPRSEAPAVDEQAAVVMGSGAGSDGPGSIDRSTRMSPAVPNRTLELPRASPGAQNVSRQELASVKQASLNVPRQHRREWLVQVHERRFRAEYPDVLEFLLDVMA